MRRLVAIGLAVLGLAVLGLLAPTPPSGAATTTGDDESWFVSRINQLRTSHGLDPLVVDDELASEARHWAGAMASEGTLMHSPDLSRGVSAAWDVLGENVGVHTADELERLFGAFVDSPGHYANLIDPRFDHVGVGVVHTADGRIWTAHRFMSVGPAGAPAPLAGTDQTTLPLGLLAGAGI